MHGLTAILLAALTGATLGALEWRRITRRSPGLQLDTALEHARHLIAALPIALLLLAVQVLVVVRPNLTWSAPGWVELYYSEMLLGGIAAVLSCLFGFATYGAIVTHHRHRIAPLAAMVVLIGIVCVVEWDFTSPIAAQLENRTTGDVVLQSTGASCAAASAANLARQLGVARTEAQMAALLGTTRFGTSPAQVVKGLEQVGIACRRTIVKEVDPGRLALPSILFLPPAGDRAGHAVLLAGTDGLHFVVLDPLVGRRVVTHSELVSRWAGHAVECAPRG